MSSNLGPDFKSLYLWASGQKCSLKCNSTQYIHASCNIHCTIYSILQYIYPLPQVLFADRYNFVYNQRVGHSQYQEFQVSNIKLKSLFLRYFISLQVMLQSIKINLKFQKFLKRSNTRRNIFLKKKILFLYIYSFLLPNFSRREFPQTGFRIF